MNPAIIRLPHLRIDCFTGESRRSGRIPSGFPIKQITSNSVKLIDSLRLDNTSENVGVVITLISK